MGPHVSHGGWPLGLLRVYQAVVGVACPVELLYPAVRPAACSLVRDSGQKSALAHLQELLGLLVLPEPAKVDMTAEEKQAADKLAKDLEEKRKAQKAASGGRKFPDDPDIEEVCQAPVLHPLFAVSCSAAAVL